MDRPGIFVAGIGIYIGVGSYDYEVELLEDQSSVSGTDDHAHNQRWNTLHITRGSYSPEEVPPDIVEIKFDKAVMIKENLKYAVRLRNHGNRTQNGDGGLNSVKGSDNTTFTFSTCSLSFNGTTLTRGQIPVVLYYTDPIEYVRASSSKFEQQARKCALDMTSSIIQTSCLLLVTAREKVEEVASTDILNKAHIVRTLLPMVFTHISSLATSDPRVSCELTCDELR